MPRKRGPYSIKDGKKTCRCCGIAKPVSEFYPLGKDGRVESWCKPCKLAAKAAYKDRFTWTITPEQIAKFWSRTKRLPDGCIVWTSYKNSYGYGQFYLNGRQLGAHRVALAIAGRNVPQWPMVPDHICKNRACVNVEHLREVPQADNTTIYADRSGRSEKMKAYWAARRAKRACE